MSACRAALLALLLAACGRGDATPPLRVACAANFAEAFAEIAAAFTRETGHEVVWTRGSTGRLFAQIRSGAPFDLFLAADQARVARLVAEGGAAPGSRVTYARGRLVLTGPALTDPGRAEAILRAGSFRSLAVAHPESAPYGAAALAVLRELGVDPGDRLLRGESVAQAWHFVASGGADLGFCALAQVCRRPGAVYWVVPARLHPPIAQDAVVLKDARDTQLARRLLAFMQGPAGRGILRRFGYE